MITFKSIKHAIITTQRNFIEQVRIHLSRKDKLLYILLSRNTWFTTSTIHFAFSVVSAPPKLFSTASCKTDQLLRTNCTEPSKISEFSSAILDFVISFRLIPLYVDAEDAPKLSIPVSLAQIPSPGKYEVLIFLCQWNRSLPGKRKFEHPQSTFINLLAHKGCRSNNSVAREDWGWIFSRTLSSGHFRLISAGFVRFRTLPFNVGRFSADVGDLTSDLSYTGDYKKLIANTLSLSDKHCPLCQWFLCDMKINERGIR